jgi:hypothetical protein
MWCVGLYGQVTDVSMPTKLDKHVNKIRVVGKNQDGYVVRISGNDDLIQIYGSDLRLAGAHTLDLKNGDGYIQYILLNRTGASVLYLHKEKRGSSLMLQPVNSKYANISAPLAIDTLAEDRDAADANLRFKPSLDGKYLLIYYPIYNDNKVASIKMTCIDHSGSIMYKSLATINRPEKDMEYVKALIDNKGNSYLIFIAETGGQDKTYGDEYQVIRVDTAAGATSSYAIKCDKEVFSEPQFEVDNLHDQLVFSGFYDQTGNPADPAATGFFSLSFKSLNGQLAQSSYARFPDAFIKDLTGREASPNNSRLFTFQVRKQILRHDGGALILAESVIRDKREVLISTPTIMFGSQNTMNNSYRTVNTYSYNDIIGFSIQPDGTIEWTSIMRKKQISEDDGGGNSSFTIVNQKEKLHLIYLEEISSTGQVGEYILHSDGHSDRKPLFGQEEKDVYLMPKLAKQVTPNEIVIPSQRGNVFRLVRIQY